MSLSLERLGVDPDPMMGSAERKPPGSEDKELEGELGASNSSPLLYLALTCSRELGVPLLSVPASNGESPGICSHSYSHLVT